MEADVMAQCADLIFTDAVQDLAQRTGMPLDRARSAAIHSPAYEALYNSETEAAMRETRDIMDGKLPIESYDSPAAMFAALDK